MHSHNHIFSGENPQLRSHLETLNHVSTRILIRINTAKGHFLHYNMQHLLVKFSRNNEPNLRQRQ